MTESTIKSSLNPQRVMGLTSGSDLYNEFLLLKQEGAEHVQVLDAIDFFRMTPEEVAKERKMKLNVMEDKAEKKVKFNFMSLYSSNSFTYNDKKKYVPSPFALDSGIDYKSDVAINLRKQISAFSEKHFVEPLRLEVDEYLNKKWGKWKGVFLARNLARGMFQYGLNEGQWPDSARQLYMHFGKYFIDQTKYNLSTKWEPIPDYQRLQELRTLGVDGWLELLHSYPYLSMLDLTASSGFPHWRTQSMKHVYDYAGFAYEDALLQDFMTIQARTQGGKLLDDLPATAGELSFGNVSWKVRVVLASSFPVKVITTPESYLWKLSEPTFTHYYKDGEVVQNRILDMIRKADVDPTLDVVNTDLDLADQTQDSRGFGSLIDYNLKKYEQESSPWMSKYMSRGSRPLKRPYVIVNPRQILKFKVMISPSGHPSVPKNESASVYAAHLAGLAHAFGFDVSGMKVDEVLELLIDILVQIDDVQFLCPKFDLDEWAKWIRKNLGFIISAAKTNTFSKDGYVTPLKVNNGFIYDEANISEITPLDGSDPSNGSFLGYLPTKGWGLIDHETGTRDDSPVVLMISEEDFTWAERQDLATRYNVYIDEHGTKYYLATKPIQSLFGTMTSFGPKVPVEWITSMYLTLRETKTYKDLMIYLRRQDSILIMGKDYGFGKNDKLIKLMLELYENHD